MPTHDPAWSSVEHFLRGRVCLFGFGNRMWRDDGIGSRVAEALDTNETSVSAVDGGFVPENHLERVVACQPDTILMIDAVDFGATAGELRLLQADDVVLSAISTHAGSPQMLAKYLQARCGAQVGLLAIQPGDTGEGEKLSPRLDEVLDFLVAKLRSLPQNGKE